MKFYFQSQRQIRRGFEKPHTNHGYLWWTLIKAVSLEITVITKMRPYFPIPLATTCSSMTEKLSLTDDLILYSNFIVS